MRSITFPFGIVFVSSNNFGDQVIEFQSFSGYKAYKTNSEGDHESVTRIKLWARSQSRLRPLSERDVVRVLNHPKTTGVVKRIRDESVCIIPTNDNPHGIGVWYQASNLKRIGRAVARVY